ncbi:(2Fe-2S)-binding protein [Streptomyces sp. enrichment culture]|uniref:(2Fe-2S)-binding protein n=1 Tax=Streptomyces sp. enrichment culture TaxID=1795815 RepID=UPI003F56B147
MNATTWDRVSAVGPYFEVTAGPRAGTAGFRPMAELHGGRDPLDASVALVGRRIGTEEARVAASTLHLGTASRLWSVALASAALTGAVPDLGPEGLWWRRTPTGPLELWLPAPHMLAAPTDTALHRTVVEQNLVPLADTVRRFYGVSPHTLRGNAASALVGAARVLTGRAPDAPHPVLPLVRALLERPPLAGGGTLHTGGWDTLTFHRHNCCLYYRVPGANTCGDCVLNTRERTA